MCVYVCVHMWCETAMVCNYGLSFSYFCSKRPNRIRTGVGVDYPPPYQYFAFVSSPFCHLHTAYKWY